MRLHLMLQYSRKNYYLWNAFRVKMTKEMAAWELR